MTTAHLRRVAPGPRPAARARWPRAAAGALALCAALAGCDALDRALAVDTPSRLPATALDNPANAELIVNSAEADFACALGAYAVVAGLMTDELQDASPTASRWSYDRRSFTPAETHYSTFGCEAIGAYAPISTARFTADDALRRLQAWTDEQVPDRTALMARAGNLAGYSLVLLGEGFCSAAIDAGPELTSEQLFALAEERFTAALALAEEVGDDDMRYLALAGRARARINQNKKAEAAADARQVPADFEYVATADESTGRRNNRVYAQNNRGRVVTVEAPYRALTFAGVADPRVPVTNEGVNGADQNTPLFTQDKYEDLSSPIPVASGDEARLIVAEAVGGAEAVAIINALHAKVGLPAFGGGSEEAIQAQVVQERSRELFLEGHHLYDTRRFSLQLQPPVGTRYPKGGAYGDARCMPLPDVERLNNENIPDVVG